jgi:hypothetical protein
MTRYDKKRKVLKLHFFILKEDVGKRFFNNFKYDSCRNEYLNKSYNNPIEYINDFANEKIKDIINNKILGIEDIFNYAFYWCVTKEGHSYWSNIDMKWKNICKKNEYNK